MPSPADHDRLHAAIARAEAATTGEIFCIVAGESAAYREVPLAWAAIVALLGPLLALTFGLRPAMLLAPLQGGWTAGQAGALEAATLAAVVGYAGLQVILFLATLGLVSIPPVRRLLTPGFVKKAHVHARALEQFAHRRHVGRAPTGVLIYASSAERCIEIVADEDIHEKVGEVFWDSAIKAATAKIRSGDPAGGLIAAIDLCGKALADNFPSDGAARPAETDAVSEI
ncbi:MAG TPA: TPM domain-containing protein [Caulobacteraceae bacterium]|jgi:putative membrane protein|nr:TPM domain-containing protein [Caulobacteraceae bacterium]